MNSYSYNELEEYEAALKPLASRLTANLTLNECYALLTRRAKKLPSFSSAFHQIEMVFDAAKQPHAAPQHQINARILREAVRHQAATVIGQSWLQTTWIRIKIRFITYLQQFVGLTTLSQHRHSLLIDAMSDADFNNHDNGICFGVSSTAVLANAVGELDVMDARLNKIYQSSYFTLSKLRRFNWRDKQVEKMTQEEVDTLACFNSIAILQNPHSYPHLFKANRHPELMSQDILKTYQLVAPIKLQRDLIEFGTTCGAYDLYWLEKYFERMRHTLFEYDYARRVTVLLSSGLHALAVTYDFEHSVWRLIDSSCSQRVSEANIARAVIQAFGISKYSFNNAAVFQASILGPEENVDAIRHDASKLIDWNEQYIRNNARLTSQFVTVNGNTLFHCAASHGNTKTLDLLGRMNHPVNMTFGGFTPLYAAAYHNHADMIRRLIKEGADVNYRRHDILATPLIIAVMAGHVESVKALLESETINLDLYWKFNKSFFEEMAISVGAPADNIHAFKKHNQYRLSVKLTALQLAELIGHDDIVGLIQAKKKQIELASARMAAEATRKSLA